MTRLIDWSTSDSSTFMIFLLINSIGIARLGRCSRTLIYILHLVVHKSDVGILNYFILFVVITILSNYNILF